MEYTIHFRGVAVFVRSDDTITEVLFPNAETSTPPEGTKHPVTDPDDGTVLTEYMLHADGTPAPKHYAGALIIGPNAERTYRKLFRRAVRIGDGGGARITGALRRELPPLVDVIDVPEYALRLLEAGQRSDPARVATRISLEGTIFSEHQSTLKWGLYGGRRGGSIDDNRFFAGAKVIFNAPDPFDILVTDLTGQTGADETIRLDRNHREVYFYHFDSALPTVDQLTKPDHADPDFDVDHDFKWVYALLNRVNPDMDTWVKWLDGDKFPAPVRAPTLVPVSTCFPTVWPEA